MNHDPMSVDKTVIFYAANGRPFNDRAFRLRDRNHLTFDLEKFLKSLPAGARANTGATREDYLHWLIDHPARPRIDRDDGGLSKRERRQQEEHERAYARSVEGKDAEAVKLMTKPGVRMPILSRPESQPVIEAILRKHLGVQKQPIRFLGSRDGGGTDFPNFDRLTLARARAIMTEIMHTFFVGGTIEWPTNEQVRDAKKADDARIAAGKRAKFCDELEESSLRLPEVLADDEKKIARRQIRAFEQHLFEFAWRNKTRRARGRRPVDMNDPRNGHDLRFHGMGDIEQYVVGYDEHGNALYDFPDDKWGKDGEPLHRFSLAFFDVYWDRAVKAAEEWVAAKAVEALPVSSEGRALIEKVLAARRLNKRAVEQIKGFLIEPVLPPVRKVEPEREPKAPKPMPRPNPATTTGGKVEVVKPQRTTEGRRYIDVYGHEPSADVQRGHAKREEEGVVHSNIFDFFEQMRSDSEGWRGAD